MKQKFTSFLVVMMFVLGFWQSASASHQVSFEMTYTCLNPATRQYRFIFHYTEICPSALTA